MMRFFVHTTDGVTQHECSPTERLKSVISRVLDRLGFNADDPELELTFRGAGGGQEMHVYVEGASPEQLPRSKGTTVWEMPDHEMGYPAQHN